MFKKIDICLTAPICKCEEENISWRIKGSSIDKEMTLILTCETCNVQLIIPYPTIKASRKYDINYPSIKNKTITDTKTKPTPEVLDGGMGKVLEFKRKEMPTTDNSGGNDAA